LKRVGKLKIFNILISLENFIKKKKKFEFKDYFNYIYGLCDSIQYIHQKSIVHLNLLPRNIFFKDNKIIIGDFGISKKIKDPIFHLTGILQVKFLLLNIIIN
jgi:serine/threonine protein kinase